MDIKKLAVTILFLITLQGFRVVHSTIPSPKPPPGAFTDPLQGHHDRSRDSDSGMIPRGRRTFNPPAVNMADFPKLLDLRMLQNMPMVILHPSKPINLELLRHMNLKNQQNTINNLVKILGTVSQAHMDNSKSVQKENDNGGFGDKDQDKRQNNNRNHATAAKEETGKDEKEIRDNDAAFSESRSTVVQHSARGFGDHSGWFEKFKGTFSNMFPHRNPFMPRPAPFGLPNRPYFSPGMPPKFPNNVHANMNPVLASNNHPVFTPMSGPFRPIHITPHHLVPLHPGQIDVIPQGSHQFPLILPFQHPAVPFGGRRLPFPQPMDHMTSASESLPHRILPPKGFGGARFVVPPSPGSSSLNKRDTPVTAGSEQISNAFADFVAAEDQDPAVVEGFASVGGSITKFLNMMGLGVSGITQGFGDFTARSLDFFPGYGNQAMLDDMDDMDVFQEDITEHFLRNQPQTTKATQKPSTKATQKPSTKATQKPSTKPPPKPSTPEKKQTVSKSVPTTTATMPPAVVSKPPLMATGKQPMQIVHPKTNISMMDKMAHLEKMKMEDTGKTEQNKQPQKVNTGAYHDGAMPKPSSMKNDAEPVKMQPQSLKSEMAPKHSPQSAQSPQYGVRYTIHFNQNHMADVNVQGTPTSQQQNPNSNRGHYKAQPVQNATHNEKPAGHMDNEQKYTHPWNNNAQHDGNGDSPSIVFGKPRIFYYSNGELKPFDKVLSVQTTYHSEAPRPQDLPGEKQNQTNSVQIPKDAEEKPMSPKVSGEKSYASAHTMPDSESSGLIQTDDVRPWVPVSTGRGYVERRPVSSSDFKSPRKEQVKEIIEMSFKKHGENSETKKQN